MCLTVRTIHFLGVNRSVHIVTISCQNDVSKEYKLEIVLSLDHVTGLLILQPFEI